MSGFTLGADASEVPQQGTGSSGDQENRDARQSSQNY